MNFLKTFFLLFLVLNLTPPIQLLAQDESADLAAAILDAEKAANEEVSYACWFGAGLTIVGFGIASIWEPSSPNPAVFVGKSPQYVENYTHHYKRTAKRLRQTYSGVGCILNVTFVGAVILTSKLPESPVDCMVDPSSACAGPN